MKKRVFVFALIIFILIGVVESVFADNASGAGGGGGGSSVPTSGGGGGGSGGGSGSGGGGGGSNTSVRSMSCSEDSDCLSISRMNYCKDDYTSCGAVIHYTCENSRCVSFGGGVGCKHCSNGCEDGKCVEPSECTTDADCQLCPLCPDIEGSNETCAMCIGLKCINRKCVSGTSSCTSQKCDDGTIVSCKEIVEESGSESDSENESSSQIECVCDKCPPIIVKPVCGNGICEMGEGEICTAPAISSSCAEGKECKVPPSVCSVGCAEDCKPKEIIDVEFGEIFKLKINGVAKIKDEIKIIFKDLIAYKCKEETVANITVARAMAGKISKAITGKAISDNIETTVTSGVDIIRCIGAGPKALLRIDLAKENGKTKNMILNLDLGEKKQVKDITISFIDYDYASSSGAFLITKNPFSCPKGCKCDENGETIECPAGVCKKGETLCPDGNCRKKCEMINPEDCKYGCLYEGKCFPMGVRNAGLYCSSDLAMSTQKESSEKCENNFECKTNVCVNGECISQGVLKKIMSWFNKMFGKE